MCFGTILNEVKHLREFESETLFFPRMLLLRDLFVAEEAPPPPPPQFPSVLSI